jgi:hypothetical protein
MRPKYLDQDGALWKGKLTPDKLVEIVVEVVL